MAAVCFGTNNLERAGGSDEGAPGLRDHTPGYHGAYCRDPNGQATRSSHAVIW